MRPTIVVAVYMCVVFLAQRALAHEEAERRPPKPGERPLQVLKAFPMSADAYESLAADLVKSGVPEKFGQDEWVSVVLTHEFHQHIGVYTILGAKMGVRARELLGAPMRAVRVTTETGDCPPMSCAIDGLQVALGSTLAQQLISVPKMEVPRMAATFQYEGRKLRLTLKPAFQKRIAQFFQATIKTQGDLTPAYFHEVEHFSYHVWAEFDRKEIFAEEAVEAAGK